MVESVILSEFRRTSRNRLILSVLLTVLAIGVSYVLGIDEFISWFRGPVYISKQELIETTPGKEKSKYVLIEYRNQYKAKHGTYDKHDLSLDMQVHFSLVDLGGEWMLVKTLAEIDGLKLAGQLRWISQKAQREILRPIIQATPELEAITTINPILDNTWKPGPEHDGIALLLLFAGFSIGLWNIGLSLLRWRIPKFHQSWRFIAAIDNPKDIITSLDKELQRPVRYTDAGPMILTPTWLLRPSFFNIIILPRGAILGIATSPSIFQLLRLRLFHRTYIGIQLNDGRVIWIGLKGEKEYQFATKTIQLYLSK